MTMSSVVATALLWAAFLALTADLSPPNLLLGLVVAALAWRITPLHPRPIAPPGPLPAAAAAARYCIVVGIDVVAGGFQVARIVFSRRMKLDPGIIAIPTGCRSEMATALSAHAITLAPGEVVVEMDAEGVAHAHCLDVSHSASYSADAQRLRNDLLSRIFPEPEADSEAR